MQSALRVGRGGDKGAGYSKYYLISYKYCQFSLNKAKNGNHQLPQNVSQLSDKSTVLPLLHLPSS